MVYFALDSEDSGKKMRVFHQTTDNLSTAPRELVVARQPLLESSLELLVRQQLNQS